MELKEFSHHVSIRSFFPQVDRLEVVNKRYVKVVFSPGKTPVDGVRFPFRKFIKTKIKSL